MFFSIQENSTKMDIMTRTDQRAEGSPGVDFENHQPLAIMKKYSPTKGSLSRNMFTGFFVKSVGHKQPVRNLQHITTSPKLEGC